MTSVSRASTLLFLLLSLSRGHAADGWSEPTLTQISGQVLARTATGATLPAKLSQSLNSGDTLTTGPNSRAEFIASDASVFRVGADTVFSFGHKPREMILHQGTLLFETPHGRGGGIIQTPTVTAGVTGSTVMVSTTSNGGVKVVSLESPCTITGSDGRTLARIHPGQLLALTPGASPQLFTIDLEAFVQSSGLIQKFSQPLNGDVLTRIQTNVHRQQKNITERTDFFVEDDSMVSQSGRGSFVSYIQSHPEIASGRAFSLQGGNSLVVERASVFNSSISASPSVVLTGITITQNGTFTLGGATFTILNFNGPGGVSGASVQLGQINGGVTITNLNTSNSGITLVYH